MGSCQMMTIFYCDHRTWTVIVIAVIARLKNHQHNLELVKMHSGDWDHTRSNKMPSQFCDCQDCNPRTVKAELREVETRIF